jgi:hypothetical protein
MRSERLPSSLRTKLWKGCFAVALFIASLFILDFVMSGPQPAKGSGFGLDYIAFYRAGMLVHTGHADRLYDLQDTRNFDSALAQRQNLSLGNNYAPFLNPPFFALLFAPLAMLGYTPSLVIWLLINISCCAGAAALLCRIIPAEYDLDPNLEPLRDWKNYALVPALMLVSLPFLQTIGHAQNTGVSLLLMTWAVVSWRDGRAFTAGVAAGILFYKPQLAALVLAAMAITLGWRALAGACASLGSLLLLNVLALPGTLTDYLHRLGPNVQYMMATHPYIWQRHATFNGFWHVTLNQLSPEIASSTATYLAILCSMPVAFGLLLCIWRNRKSTSRDRIIAAVIATAPLIMPYYLDYDLLLLAVPAVLLASEMIDRDSSQPLPKGDVWLIRLWIAFFLLLLINPALTKVLQVNLSVPMLTAIAGLAIARAIRGASAQNSETDSKNFLNSCRWYVAA